MSSSIAATEAFDFLNAGVRKHYRGAGDTPTAARDRAAREAGISRSQAERVWKRWRSMPSVDGDVYRALRNAYEHLCSRVENTAARIDREAQDIEEAHETDQGARRALAGVEAPSNGAAE
jgi:DNA-binding LacI/PurR family transcriptional regulator